MLNSLYLYRCTDDISELYAQLETEIIKDISRRIAKTGRVTATAEWQILKAQEAGMLYQEVIKMVAKNSRLSERQMQALFEEAGIKAMKYDDAIYRKAGLNPMGLTESPAMMQTLIAGLTKTNAILKNLTMTTALTAQMDYINAADLAYMEITSGAFDYNTAIKRAVKGVADKVVTMVDFASGRRDHMDVAVRRTTLTGVNQTACKLTETQAGEMGALLYETSAHAGARPQHAKWQGRRFMINGSSDKYPNFVTATRYGFVDGLGGANCRHSFYPAFEGTELAVDPEDYKYPDVSYQGNKYTYYEATQKQRSLERNIRKFKREKEAMESSNQDSAEPRMKIRALQKEAKAFSEATGVTRRRANEQI